MTGPDSVREPSLAAMFPALSHTLTELYFTLVGAVCYPSGSVPSACLPAHHINPIMLHFLGCSNSGHPPSGKREGGGHEEEEREGESEEKRRSHADTEAGTMKSGLQDSGIGRRHRTVRHATQMHPQCRTFRESLSTTTFEIYLFMTKN